MKWYLLFLGIMSLTALCLYGIDKRRAQKQKWRIKEATLLCFGFFGGAAGALLGMQLFHHKTKKWYFHAVNIAGLLLQILFLFLLWHGDIGIRAV